MADFVVSVTLSSFHHNTPVKAELLIADYCTGDLAGSVDEINTKG